MYDCMPWIWVTVVVVMSLLEIATAQFVFFIWLVVGAAVALILSLSGMSILVQLIAFVLVTIVVMAVSRPFVRKLMNFEKEDTNLGRYIGKSGLVIEEINNDASTGQVKVSGVVWIARSEKEEIIPIGEKIKVTSIDGVKLNVIKSIKN